MSGLVDMLAIPKLHQLIGQVKSNNKTEWFQGHVLALDPGETTGWVVLKCSNEATELAGQGQITTWPLETGVHQLLGILQEHVPNFLVFEAYHVYSWRLNEHSFSEVPTIQIIGCIRTLAILQGINSDCQTAQTGKAFFTDARLKSFGIYFDGQKHARDALRHACQFVTFGIKPQVA